MEYHKIYFLMEKAKQLVEEIRENLRLAQVKVEALQNEGVKLSVEVGTNSKTVKFEDVSVLEFNVKAIVNTEL